VARFLKRGTPERTKAYVFPSRTGRRIAAISVAAGGAVALSLLGLERAGVRPVVSPGPVASAHAPLGARCESCHEAGRPSDLRCERCHDAASLGGLRVAAHARFGRERTAERASARAAAREAPVACARCHQEHRGRRFDPTTADDKACAGCHRIDTPSIARHVEFALVRSGATPSRGLKMSHDRHVREALARMLGKQSAKALTPAEMSSGLAGEALSRTCETCHVPTASLAGFEPTSFDRHCAACHLEDGSVGATGPVRAADVTLPAPLPPTGFEVADGTVAKTVVSHEDPWVLFNLARIRREVDPSGYVAERARLVEDVDAAVRAARSFSLARVSDSQLRARLPELDTEIAVLEGRLAGTAASPPDDSSALRESVARFDEVRQSAASRGLFDVATAERLDRALKAALASGSTGALSPAQGAVRRAQLQEALDALGAAPERSKDVLFSRRLEGLRRRVLAWQTGRRGTGDLSSLLTERRRERERLQDEAQYRTHRPSGPRVALAATALVDRAAIDRRAAEARLRLEALAAVDELPVTLPDPAEQKAKLKSARFLLAPCRKCHETDAASLAPLAIELPLMPLATFDHKAHAGLLECGSCHAQNGRGVLKSHRATDVLVPGVARCRSCHAPSEARSDCTTCHRFHPADYPTRPEPRFPSTAVVARLDGRPTGGAR
jgi:hypothetical protein